MRFAAGIALLLLGLVVGVVEIAAIRDSHVANTVASAFAVHDPFSPRPPLELHVFSIILCLGFIGSGVALIRKRRVIGTRII